MNTSHDSTLRLVRFFLPRLTEQELREEFDELLQGEATAEHDRREKALEAKNRLLRECEDRHQRKMAELSGWWKPLASIGLIAVAVYGVVMAVGSRESLRADTHAIVLGGLVAVLVVSAIAAGSNVARRRNDCTQRAGAERQEIESAYMEGEASRQASHESRQKEIDAKILQLLRAYSESVATEDEVDACVNDVLTQTRLRAPHAAGVEDREITDEAKTEGFGPVVFRPPPQPAALLESANLLDDWIWEQRDAVIAPLLAAFDDPSRKAAFRLRVLNLLELTAQATDESRGACSIVHAVRFSRASRRYLAAFYAYELIMCMPDFVAVFRADVCTIRGGILWTRTSHIFYQEVVAIELKTCSHRGVYGGMDVDQHVHVLELAVSDGTRYGLSSAGEGLVRWFDAHGTEARIELSPDRVFVGQIHNLRSLIRDARRLLARDPSAVLFDLGQQDAGGKG